MENDILRLSNIVYSPTQAHNVKPSMSGEKIPGLTVPLTEGKYSKKIISSLQRLENNIKYLNIIITVFANTNPL